MEIMPSFAVDSSGTAELINGDSGRTAPADVGVYPASRNPDSRE